MVEYVNYTLRPLSSFPFRARSSVSPDPPGLSEFGKVSNYFLHILSFKSICVDFI